MDTYKFMKLIYGVNGVNRIDRKIRSQNIFIRLVGSVQFSIATTIAKRVKGANLDSDEGRDRAWFYSVGQL